MSKIFWAIAVLIAFTGPFARQSMAQAPVGQHVVQLNATEVFAEFGTHDCWFTQTGVENVSVLCKTSRNQDLSGHISLGPIGSCKSGSSDTISWTFCRETDTLLTWDVTAGTDEQTGTF